MKKQLVIMTLVLSTFNLVAQSSDSDSHPIIYEINHSTIVKCSHCNSEIGHIQFHEFKKSTDSYFQVNEDALSYQQDTYLCSVCRTDLFDDKDLVESNPKWNVFKNEPDSKYITSQVQKSGWEDHVNQCIICQENQHYAPGLHLDLKKKRNKNKKN